MKLYWRVNLYKLRRDAQQPPTDEEIVLQPLQPSRKKKFAWVVLLNYSLFTVRWRKLNKKGVFCPNTAFIATPYLRARARVHWVFRNILFSRVLPSHIITSVMNSIRLTRSHTIHKTSKMAARPVYECFARSDFTWVTVTFHRLILDLFK